MLERLLRGFAYVWGVLAVLLMLVGTAGLWVKADSFWDGLSRAADVWNPFNLWNFIAVVLVVSPALGAITLADRLEQKRTRRAGK